MQIIITFLIFLFLIIFNYQRTKNIFAPSVIFTIVMGFSLCAYLLKLSGIQNDYSYIYILYIVSLVLIFNICSIFMTKNKDGLKNNYAINKRRFMFITYALFFLVFFSFMIMWVVLGAPPLISKVDRSSYFLSGFGTLYLLIDVVDYLLLYDIFSNKYLKKKSYFLLFINIIMILLMANKTQLFFLICQFLVIYNIFKKKINFKKILVIPLLVIIIFVVFYQHIYKGMYATNKDIYNASKMKVPEQYSYLTEPYLYVVFNYENFFNYVNKCSNNEVINGKGYYFIKSFSDNYKNEQSDILDYQWKNNLKKYWLTTGTIFKIPLMDFGVIGTYIFAFVLGLFCNMSYKKFLYDNKNIFNLFGF